MGLRAINGAADRRIAAPADHCLEAAADVERWPEWLSAVHSVAVTDGIYVQARLLGIPLIFAVELDRGESALVIRRRPFEPGDPEAFELELECVDETAGCRASATIRAELDVPRLLPIPGAIANQVAGRVLGDLEKRVTRPEP